MDISIMVDSFYFQLWTILFLYRYVNKVWERVLAKQLLKDGLYVALMNPTLYPHLQLKIEQRLSVQFAFKMGQCCILPLVGFLACINQLNPLMITVVTSLTFYNNYKAFN